MNELREDRVSVGFCETCAERGRPNEPVYKMGMCIFCYHGKPHPRATMEQVKQESKGMTRERPKRFRAPDGRLGHFVLIRTRSAARVSQTWRGEIKDDGTANEPAALAGVFLAHYNHKG